MCDLVLFVYIDSLLTVGKTENGKELQHILHRNRFIVRDCNGNELLQKHVLNKEKQDVYTFSP